MGETEKPTPFEFKPQRECAIEDIAGGVAELIETVRKEKPDVLIFTDKSARPLSWVFNQTWGKVYPKESHPDIRFLNIGREKTPEGFPDLTKYTPTEAEICEYAAKAVEQFRIDDQLRELYEGQGFDKGKNVMVVEEQTGMKLSYQIVKQGLGRAFPRSNVRLFDADITFLGWGQAAEKIKEEEGFGEQYGKDYSAAMTGVSEGTPESIVTRPYHRKGEKTKGVNFGNIVEGKVWRPHHYLRQDLKRAVEKAAALLK